MRDRLTSLTLLINPPPHLQDALCETAYLAEVAGLHYGIWCARCWPLLPAAAGPAAPAAHHCLLPLPLPLPLPLLHFATVCLRGLLSAARHCRLRKPPPSEHCPPALPACACLTRPALPPHPRPAPLPRWEGGAGIDLKLHGFSHKLPVLAAFLFRCLAGLEVGAEAFARVKEQLLRNVSPSLCAASASVLRAVGGGRRCVRSSCRAALLRGAARGVGV